MKKKSLMAGLFYKRILGESEQLEFDFGDRVEWIGPMFWATDETDVKKIEEEFYNSFPDGRKQFVVRVAGWYKNEGDKWRLTPLNSEKE